MAASESLYMVSQTSFLEKEDDVDSLPSISTDEIYSDDDDDAQAEWERSLEQVQMLLTMVLVPWMGKYFGRKFAYWSECFPKKCNQHKHDVQWSRCKRNFHADGTVF